MFLTVVFLAELVAGVSGFVFRHEASYWLQTLNYSKYKMDVYCNIIVFIMNFADKGYIRYCLQRSCEAVQQHGQQQQLCSRRHPEKCKWEVCPHTNAVIGLIMHLTVQTSYKVLLILEHLQTYTDPVKLSMSLLSLQVFSQ